jgi:hypothetical protein
VAHKKKKAIIRE